MCVRDISRDSANVEMNPFDNPPFLFFILKNLRAPLLS